MNILLDPFTNKIYIFKPGSSKTLAFRSEEPASKPLNSVNSCMHALDDIVGSDCMNILKTQPNNALIIPDFVVSSGTFQLPALSKVKMGDAFQTRFKLCFPKYREYYMDSEEYSRNDVSVTYFYTMAKKVDVDGLSAFFKSRNVDISAVDYYSNVICKGLDNGTKYPAYFLLVGDDYSELIVWGGTRVLSAVPIYMGRQTICNPENYLRSAYFKQNDRGKKYAAFLAESFSSKKELSDESIDETQIPEGTFSKPKAMRMLKDQALEAYLLKNNIKKFLSEINDLILFYQKEPWYIPVSPIKVVCDEEFFKSLLEKSAEFSAFEMEWADRSFDEMRSFPVTNNTLFTKSIKAERRRIDWKKFLTMSIGPKKKA